MEAKPAEPATREEAVVRCRRLRAKLRAGLVSARLEQDAMREATTLTVVWDLTDEETQP